MAYKKHILLGRIIKTHGFEGAVTVKVEKDFSENIPETESVFLEIEGRPVPFFIECTEQSGSNTLRLKFDGYDTAARVKEFVGCSIYLTESPAESVTDHDLAGLQGYIVFSSDGKKAGVVKELLENTSQVLLCILDDSGKEFLVPLHEDLIEALDHTDKTIRMVIPEGLVELN
jgi:16S rRNA processing protein RimM